MSGAERDANFGWNSVFWWNLIEIEGNFVIGVVFGWNFSEISNLGFGVEEN